MTEGASAILVNVEVWTGAFGVDVGREEMLGFLTSTQPTVMGDHSGSF